MTTEAISAFFTIPENNSRLRRLVQELRSVPDAAIRPPDLVRNLMQILELMIGNSEKFDEYCSSNIQWIGVSFLSEIENFFELRSDARNEAIYSIFASAYRFLCEFEFTQPADPGIGIRRVMNFVNEHLEEFPPLEKQQLVYAAYTMPANIAKTLINNPAVSEFRKFSETVEASRKLKEEWDKNLNERQALLQGLESNIKNITSEYNFVGLVNGFVHMKKEKDGERKTAFFSLIALGLIMTLPPLAQLLFVLGNLEGIESHKGTLVYTLPTILTIEIILLYFFRVVLANFRSVKAQLLQIDLRVSLCQFIESYSEYASKVKTKDSSALGKFEAVIFSGLVTDADGIPSTFDGAEQIANLIKSFRSTT